MKAVSVLSASLVSVAILESTMPAYAASSTDIYAPMSQRVTINTADFTLTFSLPKGQSLQNNPFLKYIEKKLNVKINFKWTANAGPNYDQKVNLAIASGSIPDVMVVNEQQMQQMAAAGQLADMTSAFKNYASPLIKSYYQSYGNQAFNTCTINGQIEALPLLNIGYQYPLLWIRKDWLDKLHLKMPKTMNDVMAIAKAFVTKNPGGSKNPVGIAAAPSTSGFVSGDYNANFEFAPMFAAYGAYPQVWMRDTSGKIVYGSVQPQVKQALATLATMYKEGLIDKQFPVRTATDVQAELTSGQSGITFGPWWMPYTFNVTDPKADWVDVAAPLDNKGKFNVFTQNPHSQYLVVRKGFAHPEAVMKVLDEQLQLIRGLDADALKPSGPGVVQSGNWPEMPFLYNVDHDDAVIRNTKALIAALKAKNVNLVKDYPGYGTIYEQIEQYQANPAKGHANPALWQNYASFDVGVMNQYAALNYTNMVTDQFFGITKSMPLKWSNLQKLETQTYLNIITGAAPLSSFDTFVTQWKQQGGDQITQEVNGSVGK